MSTFSAIRAALIGPHTCLCGACIRLTAGFEDYGAYGYQWAAGRCRRCRRDMVVFGEDTGHRFVEAKRFDLEQFYSIDGYMAIDWRYGQVGGGTYFEVRPESNLPS